MAVTVSHRFLVFGDLLMTLTILKSTGRCFSGCPPRDLSPAFSRLNRVVDLGGRPRRWGSVLIAAWQGCTPTTGLGTADRAGPQCLAERVVTSSLRDKIPFLSFQAVLSGRKSLCSCELSSLIQKLLVQNASCFHPLLPPPTATTVVQATVTSHLMVPLLLFLPLGLFSIL